MSKVIIIPGRGVYPDGSLYADPKSRIQKAVDIFTAGQAEKIIMSGGFSFHLENTTNVNEADAMKRYAIQLGVDGHAVLTENKSTHTVANAYFCKKLFCEPNQWSDIIVVVSSDHLPRVKYVFNKVFGPQYRIAYQQSPRAIGFVKYTKQMLHEIKSMRLTKKWFDDVEDGDDARIRSIVLQNRPNDTMGDE